MERPVTIAVLAIGGQGGGVLVDWIVALAEREGWRAQSTSVPGVAQRTGATIYYVETIRAEGGREPVFSGMAAPGDVDIVIAAEWMEAGRAIQRGLVTPDRTLLIASTHRTFAVSEKSAPGDGAADSGAVTAAGRAAAARFLAFDMAALAEQAGSVVSSVLFGALCATGALPFDRAAFEAVIAEAGVGVQGSLRGFALGFDGVGAVPAAEGPRPVVPEEAHAMLAEGLRHVVTYQDVAYGALYLDLVKSLPVELAEVAAKYIARAMVYDDVIRVACLKTQPDRAGRIQREMGGEIVATTEFMHPRMAELLGLLPPGLGVWFEQQVRVVAWMDRVFCGPRRIRTDRIGGFLLLYLVAGLRGWRRRTLRHAREWQRIEAWLESVRAVSGDTGLATELLANQRLIKGYSDTHVRGLDKFGRVSAAAERLAGRADAAAWVRRLREAALKDERGTALEEALQTVESFLDERVPA